VKQIGRNVTGVQGDAADLDDLDRLYDTVKRRRAASTCCGPAPAWASPPRSARSPRPTSTPRFWLNARGTLFTVQKALPLFKRRRLHPHDRLQRLPRRLPRLERLRPAARPSSRPGPASGSTSSRTAASASNVLTPGQVATAKQEELFDGGHQAPVRVPHPPRPDGPPRRNRHPPPSSSPPTTPATSTAWNSSPTAAPPPSKPNNAQPGQDIS